MTSFMQDNSKITDTMFKQQRRHEEHQYLDLLQTILDDGTWEEGRNGRTKSIFGHSMRFSLKDGIIPILTTKKTAWKTCLKELLWFISGKTDNKILKEQKVHIWDANGSREFLDSRGLTDYEIDELGPLYGYQWRSFNKPYLPVKFQEDNAKYNETGRGTYHRHKLNWEYNDNPDTSWINDMTSNYFVMFDHDKEHDKGIDQLQQIIDTLKDPTKRTSRRLIMSAWNPCQLDQMALPPCHIMCQFSVKNGDQLSCAMYQRSNDCFLGQPFNIASYSFLTHLLAKHCGLKAHEFIYFMGDCHLYENAIDAAKLQITRQPYLFPTINIKKVRENINDYEFEDFEIYDYNSHDAIKVDMIA